MSRRPVDADDLSVSLFPFLAVLICTVGALIVLLVVLVQQARVQAGDMAAETEDRQESYRQLLADLRDQQEEADRLGSQAAALAGQIKMQKSREDESRSQLAALRLQLSELEKRESRVFALADQLGSESETLVIARDEASARLQALQSQLRNAQQRLEMAKKAAGKRKATYALVPYDGPYGTSRRPIYIECRRDRIILQPEGVELSQRDFRQPMGPENPLASALRATREYWRETDGRSQQAYPLLVVRPDGSQTYAVARAALKFWDAEFGYELVPEEMELAYPRPDPEVAKHQQNSIAQARLRRRVVHESRLGRAEESASGSPYLLRASSRGGFTRVAPSREQEEESQSRFESSRNRSSPGNHGYGSARYRGHSPSGQPYRANISTRGFGRPPQSNDVAVADGKERSLGDTNATGELLESHRGEMQSEVARRSSLRESVGGSRGIRVPGVDPQGTSGEPPVDRIGGSWRVPRPSTSATQSNSTEQGSTKRTTSPLGESRNRLPDNSAAEDGLASQTGSIRFSDPGASGSTATGSSSSSATSSTQRAAEGSSLARQAAEGSSSTKQSAEGSPSATASMGSSTGNSGPNSASSNWAIPGAAGNSMGITRPISVTCSMDRLVIHAEPRGRSRANDVSFKRGTASAVDELVRVVQYRISSWGMAGPNMYWKPVMEVHVTRNGESRFEELTRLLQGSGISLQRKRVKGRHATK